MSTSVVIKSARVTASDDGPGDTRRWLVMHPNNGAILAYCDTETEAERVVCKLDELAAKLEETES